MKAYKCDRCSSLYEEARNLSLRKEVYEVENNRVTNPSYFRVRFSLLIVNDTGHRVDEPELCSDCRLIILGKIAEVIKSHG